MEGSWEARRRKFLERLEAEWREGRVDPGVKRLLDALNKYDRFYTTSSCSGRIQINSYRLPGDKFDIVVVAKWHREVKSGEVEEAVERGLERGLECIWLGVHPPILHVAARDLLSALDLLLTARYAGFKHSGIQGVRPDRVVVELACSERLETPLILDGEWVVERSRLPAIVGVANKLLARSRQKLAKLTRLLEEGSLVRPRLRRSAGLLRRAKAQGEEGGWR